MVATTNSKMAFLEYALILLTLPFIIAFVFFQSEAIPESARSLIPISAIFNPIAIKILTLLSFFGCLWIMSAINQQYKFAEYSNRSIFAIGFVFALVFPNFFLLFEYGLALLCMSFVLYFLLQIHQQKILGSKLFLIGIFLSLATIFHHSNFWFLIISLVALFILRPFKFKEHLSILTAYLLPFFYLYALVFLFDWEVKPLDLGFNIGLINLGGIATQIAYAWLVILTLASIFHSFLSRSKMIVRSRKQMTVLFLFFLGAMVLAFLTLHVEFSVFLMLLPTSIFYALFHKRLPRRWIMDAFSIAVMLLLILSRYGVSF